MRRYQLVGVSLLWLAAGLLHAADLAGEREDTSAMDASSPVQPTEEGVEAATPSMGVERPGPDGRTGSAQGLEIEPVPGTEVEDRFGSFDRNEDGYISRREAAQEQGLEQRFSELDADQDGQLSGEEFSREPAIMQQR